MGAISFSLDLALVAALKEQLPLDLFVETGTFNGDTLEAVAPSFSRLLSIELSPTYFHRARERFTNRREFELHLGSSDIVLAQLRSTFATQSTFFWLDAHWCAAADTAGEKSQCPLLGELKAIGQLNDESVIVIDDARLFLSPPGPPHEISDWPDFDDIVRALQSLNQGHTLVCWNDLLLFIPRACFRKIRGFLHKNTSNLLELSDKARSYDQALGQAIEKDDEILRLKEELERNLAGWKQTGNEYEETSKSAAQAESALISELKAKEFIIQELKQVADERLKLINSLANNASFADKILIAAAAAAPFTIRLKRKYEHKLTTFFEPRTTYRIGKLAQYPPREVRPESFPALRPPRQWPRICILTPSYQQAAFLERTMESVLQQGYPNLAYGVQDGGSTDGSTDIITRHIARLAHAESKPDGGQSEAIKRGFERLYPERNDIMGWLNSDDLLLPGSLEYVANYFARNPEVDVVYGHRIVIDENDREIGRWYLPRYHHNTLKWFDLIPQETLFWRARCYTSVGGIDPSFQFAMDWDLLIRFAQAGFVIKRLPYFIGSFRVHTQQKTSAKINSVGNQEMDRIRRRIHGQDTSQGEIERHFRSEIRRSMQVEYLHRHRIRF
jgi:GT2 family glycosyltransferase